MEVDFVTDLVIHLLAGRTRVCPVGTVQAIPRSALNELLQSNLSYSVNILGKPLNGSSIIGFHWTANLRKHWRGPAVNGDVRRNSVLSQHGVAGKDSFRKDNWERHVNAEILELT